MFYTHDESGRQSNIAGTLLRMVASSPFSKLSSSMVATAFVREEYDRSSADSV